MLQSRHLADANCVLHPRPYGCSVRIVEDQIPRRTHRWHFVLHLYVTTSIMNIVYALFNDGLLRVPALVLGHIQLLFYSLF